MDSESLKNNHLLPIEDFKKVHNLFEYKDCLKGTCGQALEDRILADITVMEPDGKYVNLNRFNDLLDLFNMMPLKK
jgi:uncharacterized protein YkvS